jgi:hypothetical protein
MFLDEPPQAFMAASWSARPNENVILHGRPFAAQTAFSLRVASTSPCPPERKTIP